MNSIPKQNINDNDSSSNADDEEFLYMKIKKSKNNNKSENKPLVSNIENTENIKFSAPILSEKSNHLKFIHYDNILKRWKTFTIISLFVLLFAIILLFSFLIYRFLLTRPSMSLRQIQIQGFGGLQNTSLTFQLHFTVQNEVWIPLYIKSLNLVMNIRNVKNQKNYYFDQYPIRNLSTISTTVIRGDNAAAVRNTPEMDFSLIVDQIVPQVWYKEVQTLLLRPPENYEFKITGRIESFNVFRSFQNYIEKRQMTEDIDSNDDPKNSS